MDLVFSKPLVMLLLVVYVSVSVFPLSLAEEPQETPITVKPNNIFECLGDLVKSGGCINALSKAISDGNFADLGKECCDTLTGIGDDCLPILFPNQPTVPTLIRAICAFKKEKEAQKAN
ncbi:hypothetical protein SLE2022_083780 [Rubroshorea leprosula]